MSMRAVWLGVCFPLLVTAIVMGTESDPAKEVTLVVQVVDQQGAPVAGVKLSGAASMRKVKGTTDDQGKLEILAQAETLRQLGLFAEDVAGDRVALFTATFDDPPTPESVLKLTLGACRKFPIEVVTAAGAPAVDVEVGGIVGIFPAMAAPTDTAGKTILRVPVDGELVALFAYLPEVGFDYKAIHSSQAPNDPTEWLDKGPIRFQLAESQTIEIALRDDLGAPITDTTVSLWRLQKPTEPNGFNLGSTMTHAYFYAQTDDRGIATFRGVPTWDSDSLTFSPLVDHHDSERVVFARKEHPDGRMTVQLDRLVPISGMVLSPDGAPAEGVDVYAHGAGYQLDAYGTSAQTNDKGHFTIQLAPNRFYILQASTEKLVSPAIDGIVVLSDQPLRDLSFRLQPATRIFGVVSDQETGAPLANQYVRWSQKGRSLKELKLEGAELPAPQGNAQASISPSLRRNVVTDSEGKYEFFVGPGKQYLSVGDKRADARPLNVTNQTELEHDFNLDLRVPQRRGRRES